MTTAQYEDSVDFTTDLQNMSAHLAEALAVLNKPEFAAWMKATDSNYCQGDTYEINHRILLKTAKEADRLAHHLEMDILGLDNPADLDENCQPKYTR